jgi:uncharacterized protein YcbK (DUF882 family)
MFSAICSVPASAAETRSLKLYHVHTGEKLEIVFKRDGRFDQAGLRKINLMLRDWRRNEPKTINPRLMDLLWSVYRETGATGYINVLGGFRSPATNEMLRGRAQSGVAERSQHILGNAIDFYIPGVPLKTLREAALKMQGGGVGYYPTSGSPFVHIDVGNARMWPRMSRQELAGVFQDGRSVYIPQDGRPLPGYGEALASYRARQASGELAMGDEPIRSGWSLASLFGNKVRQNTAGPGGSPSNDATPDLPVIAAVRQDPRSDRLPVILPQERPISPSDEAGYPVQAFAAEAGIAHIPLPAVRPMLQDDGHETPISPQEVDPILVAAIPLPLSRPIAVDATPSFPEGGGSKDVASLDPGSIERAVPTAKSSRPRAGDVGKSSASTAVPFGIRRMDWAFRIPTAITADPGTRTSLAGIFTHLGSKPNLVLAEGFRQDYKSRSFARFSGSAVQFLPIRRFATQ